MITTTYTRLTAFKRCPHDYRQCCHEHDDTMGQHRSGAVRWCKANRAFVEVVTDDPTHNRYPADVPVKTAVYAPDAIVE